MTRYNYFDNVKEDVKQYINDNVILSDYDSKDDAYNALYDDMFISDSVTGNGSGSYTFSTWQAEENLCHNMELLGEALTEFGCSPDYLTEHGAEACDVTIRCYLLSEALTAVLNELWPED